MLGLHESRPSCFESACLDASETLVSAGAALWARRGFSKQKKGEVSAEPGWFPVLLVVQQGLH